MRASAGYLSLVLLALFVLGCGGDAKKKKLGESCAESADCVSGLCYESRCLDPDGDEDGDGLKNGVEANLLGTNPLNRDTDGDLAGDAAELGPDAGKPADTDGDGKIDAVESSTTDADSDCLPDQFDADDKTPNTDPSKWVVQGCLQQGVCGEGAAKVAAACTGGKITCDYSQVPGYEVVEKACDGKDNDCNGVTDQDLTAEDDGSCPKAGVCGAKGVTITRLCKDQAWVCQLAGIPGFEPVESLCDGKDNDCDGQTDEDLVDQACTNEVPDVGSCQGTTVCGPDGKAVCNAATPAPEACDGIDNNCDGQTDEGLVDQPCEVSNVHGTCKGKTYCSETFTAVCDAPEPALETCNQADDNCNGQTDEDDICLRTAFVSGTVLGLPALPVTAFPMAFVEGLGPLEGVVVTAGSCMAQTGPTRAVPLVTKTLADGTFYLPVYPGYYCLSFSLEGFQPVNADGFELLADQTRSFEVALTQDVPTQELVSACGQVVTYGTGQDMPVPVPSAWVALTTPAGDEIGNTTADENGFFCIAGEPRPDPETSPYLDLVARQDGFFEGTAGEIPNDPTRLPIRMIFLTPVPAVATTCLETSFDGSTDFTFTPDSPIAGVGWYQMMYSQVCRKEQECALLPKVEVSCQPGTEGCPLCVPGAQSAVPGCIPSPGCLPTAHSLPGMYWFGSPEMGTYMAYQDTACKGATPVGGSLTSISFPAWQVKELILSFWSAWETESASQSHDGMVVEVSPGDGDAWAEVLALRPESMPPQGTDPGVPLSSGGLGEAPVWVAYSADLTQFAGSSLRVRFRFESVDGNLNAFRGWMIDDVKITGKGCYPVTPVN